MQKVAIQPAVAATHRAQANAAAAAAAAVLCCDDLPGYSMNEVFETEYTVEELFYVTGDDPEDRANSSGDGLLECILQVRCGLSLCWQSLGFGCCR